MATKDTHVPERQISCWEEMWLLSVAQSLKVLSDLIQLSDGGFRWFCHPQLDVFIKHEGL